MADEMDHDRLQQVVHAIADRLPGEWLLVGGALVALWLDDRRTTQDLDVVGLRGDLAERYAVMRLAGELGLPVEAINSAADFFVRQIDGWERELAVLHHGAVGTIYRPTPTLFLLLKTRRLSAQDLADCEAVLRRAQTDDIPIDRPRVRRFVAALPPTADEDVRLRRERLLQLLA